jgi:hypothetical protein
MKQVVQDYRAGEMTIAGFPAPTVCSSSILVRNMAYLFGSRTERYILETSKKILRKDLFRPELVGYSY